MFVATNAELRPLERHGILPIASLPGNMYQGIIATAATVERDADLSVCCARKTQLPGVSSKFSVPCRGLGLNQPFVSNPATYAKEDWCAFY